MKIFSIFPIMALIVFLMSCAKPSQQVATTAQTDTLASSDVKTGIRGVWLTNVASNALYSKENVQAAVDLCDSLNFNTICVVTWNKAHTIYPSKIMGDLIGEPIEKELEGRDPLKELIDAAHAKNIKVIAWFEFGFSSSYQSNGGIIVEKKPEWASKDSKGKLVQKNGFEWLNGFNPEVQDFMLSLIMEVVNNYDVDGIQGDDRLPAMPSEAGYDPYTVKRYMDEHGGKKPPEYAKDFDWIDWRARIMNDFMKRIYTDVKKAKPNCLVTMAPSIFPWSKEEYLQDWPTWLNTDYVELVFPQLYRNKIEDYQYALNEILENQICKEKKNRFYPGILLQVADYNPSEEFLLQMIEANRKAGIEGEVFFFYEGIKKYKDTFAKMYPEKLAFPDVLHKISK